MFTAFVTMVNLFAALACLALMVAALINNMPASQVFMQLCLMCFNLALFVWNLGRMGIVKF